MPRLTARLCLFIAFLLFAHPAQAMPKTVEALQETIRAQYGGDANAYVEAKKKHFRKIACKGRVDLLEALYDAGLVLVDVPQRIRWLGFRCAFDKGQMAALKLILTPDVLTAHERSELGEKYEATLLDIAIYWNSYDRVRFLLETGVHTFANDKKAQALTREEHLLLAADRAIDLKKDDAIRAFRDAGFGHIVDAARNEANVRYVFARAGKGKGGGLLRGVATIAAGTALGGTQGAILSTMGGAKALQRDRDAKAQQGSGPLLLATNRADLDSALSEVSGPQRGLKVAAIEPGGAGARAGLAIGDVITDIAGQPVASRGSFYVATHQAAKAQAFEVRYLRDGASYTATFGPQALDAKAPSSDQQSGPETKTATAGTPDMASTLDELDKLGSLRDRGVLSDEEFETMKAKILEGL